MDPLKKIAEMKEGLEKSKTLMARQCLALERIADALEDMNKNAPN